MGFRALEDCNTEESMHLNTLPTSACLRDAAHPRHQHLLAPGSRKTGSRHSRIHELLNCRTLQTTVSALPTLSSHLTTGPCTRSARASTMRQKHPACFTSHFAFRCLLLPLHQHPPRHELSSACRLLQDDAKPSRSADS